MVKSEFDQVEWHALRNAYWNAIQHAAKSGYPPSIAARLLIDRAQSRDLSRRETTQNKTERRKNGQWAPKREGWEPYETRETELKSLKIRREICSPGNIVSRKTNPIFEGEGGLVANFVTRRST